MLTSDAVIQLTSEGPQAYSSQLDMTLGNRYQAEPFCFAASQAALLATPPSSASWQADGCHTHVALHEAELNASMMKWIGSHEDYLGRIAAQMLRARPFTI